MKKTLFFSFILCFLLISCNKTFLLEEKYYGNSTFNELNENMLSTLIKNKESFGVFIYQPLCVSSCDFDYVLKDFVEEYQISFYKIPFSQIKNTELRYIKYYPSFVIYRNGKKVDYLDANSNKDIEYYKSVDGFKKWFTNYVKLKEVNIVNKKDEEVEEETEINIDISNNLKELKYDENKVNIYLFWGRGCPRCDEELSFLRSIEKEYGKYFILNTFEVWFDEENKNILKNFSNIMGDEVIGVPYMIIGDRSFIGYSKEIEKHILETIKAQYKNSYDVYFNN